LFDRASDKSALHMIKALGDEYRLVLVQILTNAKSNEIAAIPKLLEMRSLKGTIVTTDTLTCRSAIAQQIANQGADQVLALKRSQGTLHDGVSTFLDEPACDASAIDRTVDADHGRVETRTAKVSTNTT
jgi:predicted transposase YbfD/YdcC